MQVAHEKAAAQSAPAPDPLPAGDIVAEADRFARRRPKEAGLIRRLGLPVDRPTDQAIPKAA